MYVCMYVYVYVYVCICVCVCVWTEKTQLPKEFEAKRAHNMITELMKDSAIRVCVCVVCMRVLH